MAINLRQTAGGTVGGATKELKVTFSATTLPNSLILVFIAPTLRTSQGSVPTITVSSSPSTTFTKIRDIAVNWLAGSFWYREGSPALNSVTVRVESNNTFQVRVHEWTGVAVSGALDRNSINAVAVDDDPDSGTTATTQLANELIIGCVINRYASTNQTGFTGGFSKMSDTTSSSSNPDQERSRMTVHSRIVSSTGTHRITADLSTGRDWVAFVATFREGTTGPAKFTATTGGPAISTSSSSRLTVFGRLRATSNAVTVTTVARIGPLNHQYLLGGWGGTLIGAGTEYLVRSIEGLEGWEMRTSDAEQARDDGELRGVDLQAARQILIELDMSGSETGVETLLDALYRTLAPQRNTDWPLIYRHPGRPLRQVWCRPLTVIRGLDYRRTLVQDQKFALKAVDPRHYALADKIVTVPVTAGFASTATAVNAGNGYAYPLIRVTGPTTGPTVTRIEMVNLTTDDSFGVTAILPSGSILRGDMWARAVGTNVAVVTVDGQSKYGGWQFPRVPLRLAPGTNELYLRTEPPSAPVTGELIYRDTWTG